MGWIVHLFASLGNTNILEMYAKKVFKIHQGRMDWSVDLQVSLDWHLKETESIEVFVWWQEVQCHNISYWWLQTHQLILKDDT